MLDEIPDGAKVSIPNDPTNGGRALLLLEKADLIKLKAGVSETATVQDVVENPKNLVISEVEAAQLPRTLDDVDISVINTNFAMNADLNPVKDALFMEDKTSPYVNIIVVREGDENRPEIKALIETLHSEKIKKFIDEKYKGAIVPAFSKILGRTQRRFRQISSSRTRRHKRGSLGKFSDCKFTGGRFVENS